MELSCNLGFRLRHDGINHPGQIASISVQFTSTGSALYRCSEPEHDQQYGETGSLTAA
jgi:hypothetical protein